jgi:hypothetical protein
MVIAECDWMEELDKNLFQDLACLNNFVLTGLLEEINHK